jgi:hypothetical protein
VDDAAPAKVVPKCLGANTVLGVLADDAEWIEPGGGNAAQGTFTGLQSVGQDVFSTIEPTFDEFSCNPENSRRPSRWFERRRARRGMSPGSSD